MKSHNIATSLKLKGCTEIGGGGEIQQVSDSKIRTEINVPIFNKIIQLEPISPWGILHTQD
jgi:hypothetical protein